MKVRWERKVRDDLFRVTVSADNDLRMYRSAWSVSRHEALEQVAEMMLEELESKLPLDKGR